MAKKSISDLLKSRQKIRIVTVFASLAVIALLVQLLVTKNPKDTAATQQQDCDNVIHNNPAHFINSSICDGLDVVIDGSRLPDTNKEVRIEARRTNRDGTSHSFKSLTITNGAILTHDALVPGTDFYTDNNNGHVIGELRPNATDSGGSGKYKRIDLVIEGTLTLSNGGKISADGKGYTGMCSAGSNSFGCGPNGGFSAPQAGGGGTHYGAGGDALSSDPNNAWWAGKGGQTSLYSYFSKPNFPPGVNGADQFVHGSAGGGLTTSTSYNGAAGGGYIKIDANIIEIGDSSSISANGADVVHNATYPSLDNLGAGAGGAVYLVADTFIGPYAHTGDSGYVAPEGPMVNGGLMAGSPSGKAGAIRAQLPIDPQNTSDLIDQRLRNITANGGAALTYNGAGGGGGGGGIVYYQIYVWGEFCIISPTSVTSLATPLVKASSYTLPSASTFLKCETKDLTIDGEGGPFTVTTSGSHNFKSLTIKGKAVVTHERLASTDLPTSTTVSTAGKNKRVDFKVSGNITIGDDSGIDVSAGGFPGESGGVLNKNCSSDYPTGSCGRGYGPGGGMGGYSYNETSGGGGGGYGGNGSAGNHNGGAGGGLSYGSDSYPVDYGSGGGAAFRWDGGVKPDGGWGGGIVILEAYAISMGNNAFIRANGSDGVRGDHNEEHAGGGGGSGGTVNITVATDDLTQLFPTVAGKGSYEQGDRNAVAGSIRFQSVSQLQVGNITPNIEAIGGAGRHSGGGGSGGRILIRRIVQPSVSIKKQLSAVSRAGATPASNFNPYALQKDDEIKVDFVVTNLTVNRYATITDEYLHTLNGTAKCLMMPNTVTINNGKGSLYKQPSPGTNSVSIEIAPDGNGTAEFSYGCKVQ